MSDARIGKYSGINCPSFGKKRSEETKRKQSEIRLGIKLSPETCEKMSDAKRGNKNPFYGKSHSKELIEGRSKNYSFIDVDGNIFQGKSIRNFAKTHGYSDSHLRAVLNGKRKSHKGLTKYKTE